MNVPARKRHRTRYLVDRKLQIPIGFVIVAMGIVLTHRIAGPLLRIEATLDDLLERGEAPLIRLRKNDELKGLCLRVNRLIERLNEKGVVANSARKR